LKLRRFWFEFELSGGDPWALTQGCGVTAWNLEDARELIRQRIFSGKDLPGTRTVIEDIDVSTLDPNHVQPNINPPIWRGIWFPQGYS
jgi:hypothetical protein